jgi:hypothetical protein
VLALPPCPKAVAADREAARTRSLLCNKVPCLRYSRRGRRRAAVRCCETEIHLEVIDGGRPELLALNGVGHEVAGQLLVTAGQNPERLTSEAAFAMLCGVAPLPAS